ncbi:MULTISPECIES: hypothetical protein [Rhizobium]|uniref:DUF333 domain-containing protein n=1 Tax=Rhizobium aouanii TaxID=3118145 RepID=A0ABU8CLI9_9HYPH|nr:hypothetical protein [Rhizobium acaciae]MCW1410750.1 hypothetical protein [Rhizobium acaciae]MCW1742951.1 hypothetical protein [Rhizobium acaciae]MCW1750147.1 hypothetical protein [Rhizobium acaciae]
MPKVRAAIIGSVALLSSCSFSGPSETDVETALGIQIHDNQCVAAEGKPGYMCTFLTDGNNWSITRRLIKTESGWQPVAGN